MSSCPAEGDCSAPEKPKLPGEVWVLIVANAVIALGYGVVAPALPQYARHFGVSISAATFVITAFALMRLCFAPATGMLIQRLGERRIYVNGLVIVALSTGACAFAQTYWQLLLFRSLGGIGSTMFFVSALGLMIRISPRTPAAASQACSRRRSSSGRSAGRRSAASRPVWASAPFLIYGAALLVAAAVVFISLRHSSLAAPAPDDGPKVTVRTALRNGAYRAALVSNLATGWSAFGLRIALVPLFIAEVFHRGPGIAGLALATFAIGNVGAVIPSGDRPTASGDACCSSSV